MTLLPLFGKEYILSLTIGCFLANVIGPYGVPDIILGTLATFNKCIFSIFNRKTYER